MMFQLCSKRCYFGSCFCCILVFYIQQFNLFPNGYGWRQCDDKIDYFYCYYRPLILYFFSWVQVYTKMVHGKYGSSYLMHIHTSHLQQDLLTKSITPMWMRCITLINLVILTISDPCKHINCYLEIKFTGQALFAWMSSIRHGALCSVRGIYTLYICMTCKLRLIIQWIIEK